MNVEKFSELVIRALGEDTDEKVDERDVLGLGDIGRAQIMDELLATGGSLEGEYVKKFTAQLEWDVHVKMWFVYNPCDLLNLSKFGAFRYVGAGSIEDAYLPMTYSQVTSYNRLEAGQMGGRTIFIPLGDKIYFRYLPVVRPCDIHLILVPSLLWMYDNADYSDLIGTAALEGRVFDYVVDRLKQREQKTMFNNTEDFK